MSGALSWERDGRDWPNREASRFVRAAGLRWHVQRMGAGPAVLLLHGTGAATHSWRGLAPLLARRFTVIAPDLPGHGFTQKPPSFRLSLPGMSRSVSGLLQALGVSPALAVGHSAAAAILARMSLDGVIAPRALVSLNGAILPLPGASGHVFPMVAGFLSGLPVVPWLFSWRTTADPAAVTRLLRNTGSKVDPVSETFYRRLVSAPGHVSGALGMMANWDLKPLARDLPKLKPHLVLVAGAKDGMVPPDESRRVHDMVPGSELISLPGLGHLAHEEQPELVARIVERAAEAAGVGMGATA